MPSWEVDLIDIFSGGHSLNETSKVFEPQSEYARQVKEAVRDLPLLVGCLGGIDSGFVAEGHLQAERGDVVLVGDTS